jgi:hypothetical protein
MSDSYGPGHARNYSFSLCCSIFFLAALVFPALVHGNTDYYRHIYFDNSLTSDSYFYSSGQASAPSVLEQTNWELPVETKIFLTPPNALRLEWQSEAGGGWEAEVRLMDFRYRYPELSGNSLYFWGLPRKRSQPPIFRSWLDLTLARAFKLPSFLEASVSLFPWESSQVICRPGSGSRCGFLSPSSTLDPFIRSGHSICGTLFFFRDGRMVCATSSSSTKSG